MDYRRIYAVAYWAGFRCGLSLGLLLTACVGLAALILTW